MADEISNAQDVIDSRDVIARIEELQGERKALVEALDEAAEAVSNFANSDEGAEGALETLEEAEDTARDDLQEWDDDNKDELDALVALQDEAEGYSADWTHGATLIRDSYFEEYAQEFAEELGMVNKDARWPNNHIDWESAAEELQQDYTSVDFDGVAYWVR